MAEIVTVYVALLNEGTDTWRPARAERVGADCFRLLGPAPEGAVYDPDDEEWVFKPGAVVHCEQRLFSVDTDTSLAATALAPLAGVEP